ncbi:hypothetical protein FNU76_15010 [Chitinimonas arctica]|uniref:Phage holin family protein n=1 Tax=Chitinimonas arctica TaxID=2594795 RepID=A0A516SHN6_9NEIS|nr:hypothetical protein [Chitinimonas arctica]QDQ27558.1 hypothetical protein FNU76_15010 [Chitinimonas arctica]
MSARPDQDAPVRPAEGGSPPLPEAGLALLGEMREMLRDRVRLFSLEARRAGLALAQIILLAVLAAMLVMTAWLALAGGAGILLVQAGAPWGLALLAILLCNLLGAWWMLRRVKTLADYLGFPALARQLGIGDDEK